MPQRLEPRERLALFYGRDEVRRRLNFYARQGREWQQRQQENGERASIFDQTLAEEIGAAVSQQQAIEAIARLPRKEEPA